METETKKVVPQMGDVGFHWYPGIIKDAEEILPPKTPDPPEHTYLVVDSATIFQADINGIRFGFMLEDDNNIAYITPRGNTSEKLGALHKTVRHYQGHVYGFLHFLGFAFRLIGLPNLLPGAVCSTVCAYYLRLLGYDLSVRNATPETLWALLGDMKKGGGTLTGPPPKREGT